MASLPLYYWPLTDIAAALRARRLSCVEVAEAQLARIEQVDPALNSYLTVTADLALTQARRAQSEIDSGRYRGPLHGIPIAVKDSCYTKGIPTSAGQIIHRDFRPVHDATVVERLSNAGAVLLGKLNMTEGAGYQHHPELPRPNNPWRADLWTGVSSSGSGVATAAGLCFASIGSDTAGSIRFPTACNALTGLKPTWGRISRHGVLDLAPSYDTVGPMARCARDVAAMLSVIAGHDPADPTSLPTQVPDYVAALDDAPVSFRVGVDWNYSGKGTDATVLRLISDAAEVLEQLGNTLRPIGLPGPEALLEHLLDLLLPQIALTHEHSYSTHKDRYGDWLRGAIEQGRVTNPLHMAHAAVERDLYKARLTNVFNDVDAILVPVLYRATPTWQETAEMTDMSMFLRYSVPFNATGNPTITLPCGFTDNGRPVGFQLVGPHESEATLLRLAHMYQGATDWHRRHPALSS